MEREESGGAHFTPLSNGAREEEKGRKGERERENDELCLGGFDTPIVFSRSTATPTGKDSEGGNDRGGKMPGVFERRTRRLIEQRCPRALILAARARAPSF